MILPGRGPSEKLVRRMLGKISSLGSFHPRRCGYRELAASPASAAEFHGSGGRHRTAARRNVERPLPLQKQHLVLRTRRIPTFLGGGWIHEVSGSRRAPDGGCPLNPVPFCRSECGFSRRSSF